MVKGISRQVILVRSPDPELFEQAIFILKDSAVRKGVTEELLMKQARAAISREHFRGKLWLPGVLWAAGGAAAVALLWAVCWLM